jgi:hypothetical protein
VAVLAGQPQKPGDHAFAVADFAGGERGDRALADRFVALPVRGRQDVVEDRGVRQQAQVAQDPGAAGVEVLVDEVTLAGGAQLALAEARGLGHLRVPDSGRRGDQRPENLLWAVRAARTACAGVRELI